jgi:enoyl-CoA hydratase
MSEVHTEIVQRAGGVVARVTIDNEAKLNILGATLMDGLRAAFDALTPRDDLRAVVLTGEGTRAFTGGADITEMAKLDAESSREFITRLHRVCEAIRRVPVPVIARIQGYALGAGLEIAAACDLRLASDDAKFGMPEVRIGIPSVIEAALLPALVGWGRTRRILYLGDIFSATDAEKWGLVERLVPAGELDAAVEEWLDAILACGPQAIRLQKKLIAQWEELPLREAVAAGIESFVAAWQTDEPRQAMQKFLAAKAARKRG